MTRDPREEEEEEEKKKGVSGCGLASSSSSSPLRKRARMKIAGLGAGGWAGSEGSRLVGLGRVGGGKRGRLHHIPICIHLYLVHMQAEKGGRKGGGGGGGKDGWVGSRVGTRVALEQLSLSSWIRRNAARELGG